VSLRSRSVSLTLVCTLSLIAITAMTGCGGGATSASVSSSSPPGHSGLTVGPSVMDFGTVVLGSSQTQKGSLTAANSSITVSSASWKGDGYSLSGIAFPVTVPAGQSISFVVTYAPQTAGGSPGSVMFVSDATDSPSIEALSGSGKARAYTVTVSWNASTSNVVGYNIYRGSQSGGPYVLINSSLQPSTSFDDNGVEAGLTYFYVITAVDGNSLESVFSDEAAAIIP